MKPIELEHPENYGPFVGLLLPLVEDIGFSIDTRNITPETWDSYYNGLLNVFKDGIELDDVHNALVTVVFADDFELELSLFDLLLNLIMWYVLVASGTPIQAKHVFFAEEITQNSIKNYIDQFLIEENRKKISNLVLNNIIDDTLHKLHDIDLFAMYLCNTLCLEDTLDMMRLSPEFRECMTADFSAIPIEDVKNVGNDYAARSIEILKRDSKKLLGYDHCLVDAFRAQQGINRNQYREFSINIGSKPDGRGGVYPAIINKSFINGGVTEPLEYFIESSTGRVAQVIKFKNVGTSGHFARNLALNNTDSRLHYDPEYDCGSRNFIKIEIKSKKALSMLNNKYYRRTPDGMDHLLNAKKDIYLLGKTIYIRSPITCASAAAGNGVCYKCYGDLAYTVFDTELHFGINIGRLASDILSAALTQRLLSAKHLLEIVINKVNWCLQFQSFFEFVDNIIKLLPELDYKDYRLLIDPESIELENDEDGDLLSDEEYSGLSMYNEYITSFDVLKVSTGEIFHIDNDRDERLFITDELNAIIKRKGEPIDGRISIGFNELKETYLFIVQIENNELTKTLNKLLSILNKKKITSSYLTISELFQDLIDTTVEGGLNIGSTHLEVILMNQVRDPETIFGKPKWWNPNPSYQIITLNEALTNNPSITISLSYQRIKKALTTPLSFRKNGPSFIDLFFMENPQKVIYDLPEEEEFVRERGEIVDPMVFTDDYNRITVASPEEINYDVETDE